MAVFAISQTRLWQCDGVGIAGKGSIVDREENQREHAKEVSSTFLPMLQSESFSEQHALSFICTHIQMCTLVGIRFGCDKHVICGAFAYRTRRHSQFAFCRHANKKHSDNGSLSSTDDDTGLIPTMCYTDKSLFLTIDRALPRMCNKFPESLRLSRAGGFQSFSDVSF